MIHSQIDLSSVLLKINFDLFMILFVKRLVIYVERCIIGIS